MGQQFFLLVAAGSGLAAFGMGRRQTINQDGAHIREVEQLNVMQHRRATGYQVD